MPDLGCARAISDGINGGGRRRDSVVEVILFSSSSVPDRREGEEGLTPVAEHTAHTKPVERTNGLDGTPPDSLFIDRQGKR